MRGSHQIETPLMRLDFKMPRATPKQPATLSRRRGTGESVRPLRQTAEELMELAVDAAQSRHLPEFLERFPMNMIASYLGLSPETISRVRKMAIRK